jgi:hypothetical protein
MRGAQGISRSLARQSYGEVGPKDNTAGSVVESSL